MSCTKLLFRLWIKVADRHSIAGIARDAQEDI